MYIIGTPDYRITMETVAEEEVTDIIRTGKKVITTLIKLTWKVCDYKKNVIQ
jgi:hypothetical protein